MIGEATVMVRKHYAATKERARFKRHRPKTPAPKNGWLLTELARVTGLTASTIRYYVQQRLIRPMERRGTQTRYARPELLRLLGLVRLRNEGKSTLEQRKRQLDAMGDERMEEWLRSAPLPQAAATALGYDAAPTNTAPGITPERPQDLATTVIEHWQRIALLPGLDLMLRGDAREPARLAAQRIIDEYVVAPLRLA
jgi:DNA-binding transcriptional MerR regulator